MNFLRRLARQFLPDSTRTNLVKFYDAVLIWQWKFRWLKKRGFRPIQAPKRSGVLLVGYLHGGLGIGSTLRLSALALKEAEVPFKVFDFNPRSHTTLNDHELKPYLTRVPEYSINIFCIGLYQLPILKKTLGKKFFQDRRNILYGAWELSRLPEQWIKYLESIDEIWAMSSFVGQMFRRSTSIPVYDFPLPIHFTQIASYSRYQFQIPKNNFVFLFMFDFDSHVARKNPEGVIKAFKIAFPKSNQIPVSLVVKSINVDRHMKKQRTIDELINGDSRIIQIHKVLTHNENKALIHCCDCYVSLHRSEGFGLTIAEAMLTGKPVITTGYSGNMDFTTDQNSLLVDYKLVPVQMNPPYQYSKGEIWAEPDIEQAGEYMQKLLKDTKFANYLAEKGQEMIRNSLSIEAMGERYKNRLNTIFQEKSIGLKNL